MTNHPFLTAAETRATHLRELSLHLRALEVANADLADIEREIPQLEAAMAVYRRLHSTGTAVANGEIPKTGKGSRTTAESGGARKPASTARRTPTRRRAEAAPSFKDFARTRLDSLGKDGGARINGKGHANGDSFAPALPPRVLPAS